MKQKVSLNGQWKFVPTYDQKPTNNHNVLESKVPMYTHPDLIRTGWDDVTVPGVWQKYAEKYSVFEGVCWFYREFEIEELTASTFAELVCKGINYKADIYVNGFLVGVHESAYTEFSFDISKFLRVGKNAIAIQVDNRPTVVKWPNDWGYGVFGGIHRDIFINLFSEKYVYDIEITPDYDIEKGKGLLYFKAKGKVTEVSLKLEGHQEYIIKNKNGKYSARLAYDNVCAWSPQIPKLYKLSVCTEEDNVEEYRVGFRNVACKKRAFLLNGNPIELKGACYLSDTPKNGLAVSREELRADLIKMKQANVNSIRTHYPMSDDFYELCDELGFLVWIEPNIYCSKPSATERNTVFKRRDFVDVAVRMTEEMIKGARRFASVAIYGIGNECNTAHPEALPFFEKISSVVRKNDFTRPIGYASFYGQCKEIAHTVDVMGINSYFGWYGVIDTFNIIDERNEMRTVNEIPSLIKLIETVERDVGEDKVIMLTEFGGDSVPKFISPECALWSENYHALLLEKYIEAARAHDGVAGYFVFAFTDYTDPSKPNNGRWNGFNLKGMITYDRQYKLPYYALQKAYGLKVENDIFKHN